MSVFRIALIVEGQGDVESVPILIGRIATVIDSSRSLSIQTPYRVSRSKIVKEGEMERYVTLAVRAVRPDGAVLFLMDSDDDCAATLGPELRKRAESVAIGCPQGVVFAVREFESWFLAASSSLSGTNGLQDSLPTVTNPENIRDAKGWISDRMEGSFRYRETINQSQMTRTFDMNMAFTNSPSFRKLWRDVERLMDSTP